MDKTIEAPIGVVFFLFFLMIGVGIYFARAPSKNMLSEGPALRQEFEQILPPNGAEPSRELEQTAKRESAGIEQSYKFALGTELLIPFYSQELTSLGWSQLRRTEKSVDYCKGPYLASMLINVPEGTWSYSFAIARSSVTEGKCAAIGGK